MLPTSNGHGVYHERCFEGRHRRTEEDSWSTTTVVGNIESELEVTSWKIGESGWCEGCLHSIGLR
jgi:hypothetical protein